MGLGQKLGRLAMRMKGNIGANIMEAEMEADMTSWREQISIWMHENLLLLNLFYLLLVAALSVAFLFRSNKNQNQKDQEAIQKKRASRVSFDSTTSQQSRPYSRPSRASSRPSRSSRFSRVKRSSADRRKSQFSELLVADSHERARRISFETRTKLLHFNDRNEYILQAMRRIEDAKTTPFAFMYPKSIPEKERIAAALVDMEDGKAKVSVVNKPERYKLAEYFEPVEFPTGAIIIRQGEVGDYYYVINSGKVDVHIKEEVSKPNLNRHSSDGTSGASPKVPKPNLNRHSSDGTSGASAKSSFQKFKKTKGSKSTFSKIGQRSNIGRSKDMRQAVSRNKDALTTLGETPEGSCVFTNDISKARLEHEYGPCKETLQPGESFGELALIYSCTRQSTCIAAEPCKLWRIDRLAFRHVMKDASIAQQRNSGASIASTLSALSEHSIGLHSLPEDSQEDNEESSSNHHEEDNEADSERSAILSVLRKVQLFSNLDEPTLQEIAYTFTSSIFQDGELICKKGDIGHDFYIVKSGTVAVTEIGTGDSQNEDVQGGPGFWFGERALLTGEKRIANVAAINGQVNILSMTRTQFEKRLGPIQKVLDEAVLKRELAAISLFSEAEPQLSHQELSALVDSFKEVEFPAKHKIATAGENMTPAVYIIKTGQVYIAVEGTNSVYTLYNGGYFGQGQLQSANSSCIISDRTIVADTETKCFMLTRDAILQVVGDMSRLGKPKPYLSANLDRTIKLDQLERKNILGIGGFGKVWLVKHKEKKDSVYGLKVISKKDLIERDASDFVIREKNLMASVNHPLIVRLVATMQDKLNLYMLMDFVQGGELMTACEKYEDGLPNTHAQFYGACIAEALSYMHHKMICHRDLKPENVMIDKDGYCVLIDLGFAKVVHDRTYTVCGTPEYLSPEVILGRGHNRSGDFWALGVLIYEMLVGQTPFAHEDATQESLFRLILRGEFDFPDMEMHGIEVPLDAQDLITKLLEVNIETRLELIGDKLCEQLWFGGLHEDQKLRNKELEAPWVPEISDPLDTAHFACFKDEEALFEEYEVVVPGAHSEPLDGDDLFKDFASKSYLAI